MANLSAQATSLPEKSDICLNDLNTNVTAPSILPLILNQRANYEFEEKGLRLFFELGPPKINSKDFELINFKLEYEPRDFSLNELFRIVLGRKPMRVTIDDLQQYQVDDFIGSPDPSLRLTLRKTDNKTKSIESGPVIYVSLLNGQIAILPSSKDTRENFSVPADNSFKGLFRLTRGLALEFLNTIRWKRGQWILSDSAQTDAQLNFDKTKQLK